MAFGLHHRVTFGGGIGEASNAATDEIWACNVNVKGQAGENIDEDAYLASIGPKLATWFRRNANGMSWDANISYVKCNKIGPNGRYTDSGATHRFDITPAPYGGASPVDPGVITNCISWSTAKSRGPGSHGRIYPPNATYGPSGTMKLDASAQTAIAQTGFDLLTILVNDGEPGPTLVPIIASSVDGSLTPITGVRVGNTKDVQRRRKDALRETYKTQVFTQPIVTIEN